MNLGPELDTKINPSLNQTSKLHKNLIPIGLLFVIFAIVLIFLGMQQRGKENIVPSKTYTIGILRYIKQVDKVEEGFYQGMKDLGYIEGQNVHYVVTPYGESPAKMQGLAQGLIDQNVDLIVAITSVAAGGAKKATEASNRTDLPIVFTHSNQPDKQGHIQSFQSSGNNLTGVAINYEVVTEKKLEFLKRIDPSIKRIGTLDADFTDPAGKLILEALKNGASKFGVEIVPYKVKNDVGPKATQEIAGIASSINSGDIDAFFHLAGPVSNPAENVQLIIDMAKRLKIPAVYLVDTQVEQGGLFSYAHDMVSMGKQTSVIVDKVLRGTKPTDIPTEYPNKNGLVFNLKTAQEIGITIPESLLSIADRIIK